MMEFQCRFRNSAAAAPIRAAGLLLMLTGLSAPALASGASPWSAAPGAAIRLLAGTARPADAGDSGLAGLEIRLDQGWKTYWRNPGDSGVPPVFDWSKSQNLASVTVLWPAPTRLDDEGGASAVYKGDVVLPLRVAATDASKPVVLHLTLAYGICHDICVPAKGEASLTFDPASPQTDGAAAVAEAARQVPVPTAIGASSSPSIRQVRLDSAAKPPVLTIDVATPRPSSLFVEGPADWYLPMPAPAPGADKANPQSFVLPLEGLPSKAVLPGTPLRFTLSTGEGGIESLYRLP
ncbi:protein-disulfide reductase DsbD domain-containing protein [Labrys monachus]|uniref:DsbC/DsbD-like thiol-disulfide interchange protein n=1 Tax=Labrys monachus TaxID=217067 RepID=A0ABU0FB44_9HYPH|nr:protein-disulfide reductase DsbD domain-containing protein [Labrys monachus]MDQ0391547.1 DsbC/DsbD-like thiol-disulfide interchange protein [Labrys monachus]